jgi:hypothetical protein
VALIRSEPKARKLANAIISDIRLYNAKTIEKGDGLAEELAEGRALFVSRVSPELSHLYDEAAQQLVPVPKGIRAEHSARPQLTSQPEPCAHPLPASLFGMDEPMNAPTRRAQQEAFGGKGGGVALLIAVGLVLVSLVLGWVLLPPR